MSIYFGDVRQIGCVVKDAETAMAQWAKAGVGPFVTMRFTVDNFIYRGKPGPGPDLTLCFAHSGPIQVELIQQHNDVPSAYTEFLESGREGVQHISSWFSDHESFDAKRLELINRGYTLVHEGGSDESDARFAYFDPGLPGGLMVEISEALIGGPDSFVFLENAAKNWNGENILFDGG